MIFDHYHRNFNEDIFLPTFSTTKRNGGMINLILSVHNRE